MLSYQLEVKENNMFDPKQFGAVPVNQPTKGGFDASQFGATPVNHLDAYQLLQQPAPTPSLPSRIGSDLSGRFNNMVNLQSQGASGQTPAPVAGLGIAGQIAGGVGDVVGEVAKSAGSTLLDGAKNYWNSPINTIGRKIIEPITTSQPVQSAVDATKSAVVSGANTAAQTYQDWKAQHPNAAIALEATGNLASLLPIGKGAQLTKESAVTAVPDAVRGISGTASSLISTTPKETLASITKDIIPQLTPTEGAARNKAMTGGLFNRAEYVPTKVENQVAQTVHENIHGYGDAKTFVDKENLVKKGIEDISTRDVSPVLTDNPTPFHFQDFRDYITRTMQPTSSLKNDPSAMKTFSRIREDLLAQVAGDLKQNPNKLSMTDNNELWDSRKGIDNTIKRELGEATFGTPQFTGVKAAATSFRDAYKNFLIDNIKNSGNMTKVNQIEQILNASRARGIEFSNIDEARAMLKQHYGVDVIPENELRAAFFENSMGKMNDLYQAGDALSTKANKEIGTSRIGRAYTNIKKYPVASAVLGAVGGDILARKIGL